MRMCEHGTEGSSPLMRGKQLMRLLSIFRGRLIPAHAGKTSSPQETTTATSAHPRSCGENCAAHSSGPVGMGSSPLMRGKRGPRGRGSGRRRLIPAHAGKTPGRRRSHPSPRAHPRSCGENRIFLSHTATAVGSSPLMRGKLPESVKGEGGQGLIPAHAGKTLPDLLFYHADRSDLGKP